MSALSTTAIKDGHQGHTLPHGHHHRSSRDSTSSSTTLDAERADRISRLAGLERVSTARPSQSSNLNPSHGANPPPSYFENAPPHIKERSTVGSASATGSVGGRTTWASGSIDYDADKMSEDQEDGVSSTEGFSDENASLVGFGEGAGSTVSVPISTATSKAAAARYNPTGSPSTTKFSTMPPQIQQVGAPIPGAISANPIHPTGNMDHKMMDGMTYDANVVDTTMQPPIPANQQTQNPRGFGAGQGITPGESMVTDPSPDDEIRKSSIGSSALEGVR
ncbi:hypothetical protein HC762_00365 [bacterium]|nr:hypothetical protein [bacterium]